MTAPKWTTGPGGLAPDKRRLPCLAAALDETYATADIVEYDGERRVKVGREFLFRK